MAEQPEPRDMLTLVCPLSMAGPEPALCRGDCWAFKGSHDRRDICQLFDSINQISMSLRVLTRVVENLSKYTMGGNKK